MSLGNYLEMALYGGYSSSTIDVKVMFVCLLMSLVLSFYIWFIYDVVNKRSFYDPTFNLSLLVLSLITAAIILTIQSNIVVSLGMVGALSIVRFRTAIKSSMDLVFLFWSISIGIICGAGYAMIAIIASLIISITVAIFSMKSTKRKNQLLVINAIEYDENKLNELLNKHCTKYNIRAVNVTDSGASIAIEVVCKNKNELINECKSNNVISVSLLEHNGDVTA